MSVISYFLKIISKNQIVYCNLYAYADGNAILVSAFKYILIYFQHTFYSLFIETVSSFDHLLNLYHYIRRGFILMGKISYNG